MGALVALIAVLGAAGETIAQEEAPARRVPSMGRSGVLRVHAHFYAGAGGGAATFFRGEHVGTSDLRATFGLQLQALVPVHRFFLVGGSFSFRSIQGEGAAERVELFGLDAEFGAHYAIELGTFAIDPYLVFRIGLGIASPQDQLSTSDTEFGVDLGMRAGVNVWFLDAVGASFGLGYQQGSFYPNVAIADDNAHVRVAEVAFEMGIALRFGYQSR